MTTSQIEKTANSAEPALQERVNADWNPTAGEIDKLFDANFPEPAFPDLAGQSGFRPKAPATGSVEAAPSAATTSTPAPQPASQRMRVTTGLIPLHKIRVAPDRGPLNEEKVIDLVTSIGQNVLLQPPVVRGLAGDWWLVAGAQRLEALRRLGWKEVLCVTIESKNSLRWELAQIDENLIRNDLGPSEHAKQTREKIRRSRKRANVLGAKILNKTQGTSLDKGTELDALMELPKGKREELVERAAAGEVVTARAPVSEPATSASPELPPKDLELEQPTGELPDDIALRQALRAFRAWRSDFGNVLARWETKLSELETEIEECIR
jgi:ParB-like chromosome segregation protein Spo0J